VIDDGDVQREQRGLVKRLLEVPELMDARDLVEGGDAGDQSATVDWVPVEDREREACGRPRESGMRTTDGWSWSPHGLSFCIILSHISRSEGEVTTLPTRSAMQLPKQQPRSLG
jgi:hypothetical protein